MKAASAADDRLAFAPPKQPGLLRALALAVLAHALLVLGLMQGLQWKRDGQQAAVEAELWSAVPQQAAPREVPAPPPPPPAPPVQAPPRPEPPEKRDADIALERAQKQRELEKQKQAELEREREREQRKKLEAQKKREEELAKKREEELARKKRDEEEARKKQEEQKLAEARRKEDDKKRKEQEARDVKKLAQMREENLRRIQGMAGGTGAADSTGTAARASGPSPGWAGKVQARVRPHIVFSDDVSGNPKAEVEVRASPDGTIVSTKLVRSSGVKAWDEAVLRALDKAGALPRDADGRVPSPVLIEFRPKG